MCYCRRCGATWHPGYMHTDTDAFWHGKTGAYLLKQERAALATVLPTIFGYHLVQSGCWGEPGELLETSAIRNRIIVGDCGQAAAIAGNPAYLPFAADAIDAVLLPHTLERVADPRQVLREAERVLHGEGHVLVLGFHPWGPWGLRGRFGDPAWSGNFLRFGRLQEWLSVLGFDIVCVRHLLFRPPWRSRLMLVRSAFLDRMALRPTAGAYLLVARKRVFSMTPLRLRRERLQPSFSGVAKPTTRSLP